jgi:hypothetical protein
MLQLGVGCGTLVVIFYLHIAWSWVVRFTSQPLYPSGGNNPFYILDRKLTWLQSPWKLGCYDMKYDMIYLLTAIGLSPGGSSTVHIYTQTMYRTTQTTTEQHK